MAFQDLDKPGRVTATAPTISLGRSGRENEQTYLSLNAGAIRALGEPAAVRLAWDPDRAHLAVIIASPEDPRAYKIAAKTSRISVTQIMRQLGINVTDTKRFTTRPHGRTGLVIDLSSMPTASTFRRAS